MIGAVSGMDTPMTPYMKGARNVSLFLSGVTEAQLKKERDQVLGAGAEDIRALADIVEEILGTGALCAVGNGGKIKENSHMFGEVKNLYT